MCLILRFKRGTGCQKVLDGRSKRMTRPFWLRRRQQYDSAAEYE